MRKMKWDVTIFEVDNGYVVKVGCKVLVFTDWKDLSTQLNAYASGQPTALITTLLTDTPRPEERECAPSTSTPQQPGVMGTLAGALHPR